ncbi:GTPase ObgE [Latilactobacillus curvatus]|jgi:GTP-binding protein|uniref:GTPase Obg n=2 Tax=Latilactobacillus curvatus TaxID=28038 RepID=A0A1X7QJ49_LATCU|nr:GTPase ObgE [Latilactobacillus curvatus]ASN60250.1 GTPase ObgE [Latilactobacillus curvatus]AXN35959.1 GTPase ObgE [Latilactobacillus curvatus]KRK92045.1 obg family GTPase CgtA [Latilactobacillus curvatus JCM 1096 = DSM 20019]MCS8582101.1 GTPase ObgE [Latilactobacillus curvatus]MCS8606221.1 GTPase ObgE [Latilactobacillus curvatus]
MFVDQVKIDVKAGKGGDGAVAFRREKFVPLGGPAGGDGGRGGSVILVVDEGLRTLMDFRYRHHFKANSGGNGQNKQMYGRGAEDTFVQVPPGTTVRDAETNELLGDLTEDGQQLVIAKGGRGGRGNMHFANARNSAPEVAENGEPGEERSIQLELKVLADVGLVGFPSVGKSTLLSVVTSAKPKIASYQFTTLVPNLGMVQLDDGRDFVLADLPGLIEGASDGVGLGIQFLRHVERTRVVLHLIEMDDQTGRDPFEDYQQINHELETYDPKILERPQVIVATKMDLPGSSELLAEFKQKLAAAGDTHEIFEISSITHQGVQPLMNKTADLLAETTEFPMGDVEEVQTQKLYQYQPEAPAFIIEQDEYGTFIVSGDKVEKLFKMSNLDHQDGVMRFARQLRSMGIDEALRESGAHDGDLVAIDNFTFEFVE